MLKITPVVKQLFLESDAAQLAASEDIFNASGFARNIQQQVENATMKEVSIGTITRSLYRILDELKLRPLKPRVDLSSFTIYPQVTSLTYNKTVSLLQKTNRFLHDNGQNLFYTLTQGTDEITIIADQNLAEKLANQLAPSNNYYPYLSAVSVKFSPEYLTVPNMIYTLMASLAVKHINVIEIVSTLTSLTFVVYEKELDSTIEAMKKHVR